MLRPLHGHAAGIDGLRRWALLMPSETADYREWDTGSSFVRFYSGEIWLAWECKHDRF